MTATLITAYVIFVFIHVYTFVKLKKRNEKVTVKSTVASFLIFSFIFLCIVIFSLNVSDFVLVLSMISITAHNVLGYLFSFYEQSQVFDRFLHFFGTFSFTLLAHGLLVSFIKAGGSKIFKAIFVFTLGVTIGVIFEFLEFKTDSKKGTNMQKGLKDTNTDMIGNAIGALAAAVFAYLYII